MNIRIEGAANRRPGIPKDQKSFGFGKIFTDRLFLERYSNDRGWYDPAIIPYDKFPKLDPAAAALHYGQEIFEGTKAFRRPDRRINLFRPEKNAIRFNKSAERMEMPTVSISDHLEAIRALVREEQAWVPFSYESSLYIRPTMIAVDPHLGVHPSENYLHYILLSLAGDYFPDGFQPIAIKVEADDRRAVFGGTGEAKTGANYAASLSASARARREGYSQVLWLDGQSGTYIEEVGAMNIMIVYNHKTIVTPALTGSILHGVTRESLLELAPDLNYRVEEARIEISRVLRDIESGEITEIFGCGTAAVIAPVGRLGYRGRDHLINGNQIGPVAEKLRKLLTNIQYGIESDPYGWTEQIDTH